MIFIGIGQIVAGALLVVTGLLLSTPPTEDWPILGAIAAGVGIFTLYRSIERVEV